EKFRRPGAASTRNNRRHRRTLRREAAPRVETDRAPRRRLGVRLRDNESACRRKAARSKAGPKARALKEGSGRDGKTQAARRRCDASDLRISVPPPCPRCRSRDPYELPGVLFRKLCSELTEQDINPM